jgi:hypothetical protein
MCKGECNYIESFSGKPTRRRPRSRLEDDIKIKKIG